MITYYGLEIRTTGGSKERLVVRDHWAVMAEHDSPQYNADAEALDCLADRLKARARFMRQTGK